MKAFHLISAVFLGIAAQAQFATSPDSLRGSLNPHRDWWDVQHYEISITPDFGTKSISGATTIEFVATKPGKTLQIDLQQPLSVDRVHFGNEAYKQPNRHHWQDSTRVERKGNIFLVHFDKPFKAGQPGYVHVRYSGQVREAVNPPWDGGWIWKTDSKGNPWMSAACQGLGASVWYPCKDHQSDEPDNGADLLINVPDTLVGVGNGRLVSSLANDSNGTTMWHWRVTEPINNYNIIPYIGSYAHIADSMPGADGTLSLDYWVLEHNVEKAKEHFQEVKPLMNCFEEWFGPYPFYDDGFKLVEAPHLGMEHQSAVAYGNAYRMGYLGRDLSGTGIGLKFDFIIVHESGHEWFGNNITTADIADMWVHEGFTAYSETVYAECLFGKERASDYVIGTRRNVLNNKPVIGPYGVNKEGSGDMYYKAANMLHMIRFYMGDEAFKKALHDMNVDFRHSIVTSAQIEDYLNDRSEMDLAKIFDQYLRHRDTPRLEYKIVKKKVMMRFRNCGEEFQLPVHFTLNGEELVRNIGREWLTLDRKVGKKVRLDVQPEIFVKVKEVPAGRL